MKSAFLVLSVVFMSTFVSAQSKFNGSVSFDVDYKGDMVDMLRGMLPNKQVYHYSDGNFRMETKGGMASGQGDILYIDKTEKTYVMNSNSKKAQEMPQKDAAETDANVTVTETGETATILAYTCDKYKVVVKMDDTELTQYVWATKALEPVKPKNANSMGAMASITSKIKGMPLKIQMEIEQMGLSFSMIMTATSLDDKAPSKDLFVIPGDYTVEPFNPKSLIGR
jgi:hypothetical protein